MWRAAMRLLQILAIGIGLSVFAAAILAYFVTSLDPESGRIFDGLGRELEPTPLFIGSFFDSDRQWSGWGWFATDFIWFWGGLAAAWKLYEFAEHRL